ncbi:hypothetical protein EDD76_11915 [Kineothrix alysoides]|uniref:HEAT repeat protein n=1 Tax=Kineothrix alysoides TaxID=1469948 RepID=A0A4V2QB09_9FIRM|nr:hypothetical protein [Kineothrix alysoides]TCL54592.1 hypothetical protein EDD76_11915 [Kineothrix alysoides]
MLEKLACANNRNDETLNIELARHLCESEDKDGVNEIVSGLKNKDKKIANDCIKVLYEIGEAQPDLIADYVNDFIRLLHSPNNRLIWGAMTALSTIVELKHPIIYENVDSITYAIQQGSVITVDNGVSVLARLCVERNQYRQQILPFLMEHLKKCRPKEVAQHAERISVCIDCTNVKQFLDVLDGRIDYLSKSQQVRIVKLKNKLQSKYL